MTLRKSSLMILAVAAVAFAAPVNKAAAIEVVPVSGIVFTYIASLSGSAEATPNNSPGTGTATLTIDITNNVFFDVHVRVQAEFSGLLGTTTGAGINCCTVVPGAGVSLTAALAEDFPIGVTSGTYDRFSERVTTFPFGFFSASFVAQNGGTLTGSFDRLLAGLANGEAYFNIYSSQFLAGEIRGFFARVPDVTPVPLPAALPLFATGLGALGLLAWRRKRKAIAA